MKKIEIALSSLFVLGLIFKMLHYPGAGILILLSFSTLSMIYGYLGFAIFNDIRTRKIFKKESYRDISTNRILGAVGVGFILSIALVAIVFKIQSYPGATPMMMLGVVGLIIVSIFSSIKIKKDQKGYYKRILKRVIPFSLLILLLLNISKEDILHLEYPNNPEYVKIYMDAFNNHDSTELWDKVEQARLEMDSIQLEQEFNEASSD